MERKIAEKFLYTPVQLGLASTLRHLLQERRRVRSSYGDNEEFRIEDIISETGERYIACTQEARFFITIMDQAIASVFEDLAYKITYNPKIRKRTKQTDRRGMQLAHSVLRENMNPSYESISRKRAQALRAVRSFRENP